MPATNGGDLLSGALTADEKDTLSAIIGILGTGAGALTGDSAIDAVIGDSVASNMMGNNCLD